MKLAKWQITNTTFLKGKLWFNTTSFIFVALDIGSSGYDDII